MTHTDTRHSYAYLVTCLTPVAAPALHAPAAVGAQSNFTWLRLDNMCVGNPAFVVAGEGRDTRSSEGGRLAAGVREANVTRHAGEGGEE